ncbi:hypothetical protein CLOP_g3627 [Closterium sp. NIES-67]|nr:hypothetical protein CLOP_g3627 [Closterium sp. NIES-67]
MPPPPFRRIRSPNRDGNFRRSLPLCSTRSRLLLGLLIALLQLTVISVVESLAPAAPTRKAPIRYAFTRGAALSRADEATTSRSPDLRQRRVLQETDTTVRPSGIARVYNASQETPGDGLTAAAAAAAAAAEMPSESSLLPPAASAASPGSSLPFTPRSIDYHWDDTDPDQMAFCAASPAHCGVMHAPVGVYIVWYGAKFTEEQKDIVRLFVASLNADNKTDAAATVPNWWAINTLYFDQQGRNISSTVTVKGETHDTNYSRGTMLLHADVAELVQSAVGNKSLPYDPAGVYFVLSDEDVSQMDDPSDLGGAGYALAFCSHYCGWHSFAQGRDGKAKELIISFVGNAVNQCPDKCIPSYLNQPGAVPPNGDAGMDGMVSVLAHELAEATSSPFLATWFDAQGEENADICSWSYGDVVSDMATGVQYNLVGKNGAQFLVQANLDPRAGSCAISPIDVSSSIVGDPTVVGTPPSVDVPEEEPPPSPPSFLERLVDFITSLFGF